MNYGPLSSPSWRVGTGRDRSPSRLRECARARVASWHRHCGLAARRKSTRDEGEERAWDGCTAPREMKYLFHYETRTARIVMRWTVLRFREPRRPSASRVIAMRPQRWPRERLPLSDYRTDFYVVRLPTIRLSRVTRLKLFINYIGTTRKEANVNRIVDVGVWSNIGRSKKLHAHIHSVLLSSIILKQKCNYKILILRFTSYCVLRSFMHEWEMEDTKKVGKMLSALLHKPIYVYSWKDCYHNVLAWALTLASLSTHVTVCRELRHYC